MSSRQNLFTIETILANAVSAKLNPNKEINDSWDVKIAFDPSTMPQVLFEFPSLAMFDLETAFLDETGLPITNKRTFAINELRVEGNVMFILFSVRIIINGISIAPPRKSEIKVGQSIVFYFKKRKIKTLEIILDIL